MKQLSNWELALIDEIDDILHDNWDNYETGIDLPDNMKQEIARDVIDTYDWSDLRYEIMQHISEKLKERLNYLRSLDNITTLDPRSQEYEELCILNAMERGEL